MSTAAILNISEFKLLNQLRGVDYYKIALWSIGSGMDLNIQLSNNQRRRFLQIKIAMQIEETVNIYFKANRCTKESEKRIFLFNTFNFVSKDSY